MPEFIPGLELSRLFYWEVVRPLMDRHYPGLPHAAALIGLGSEVLGFDTQMPRPPTTSGGGTGGAPQVGQLAGGHRGGDERTHALGRSPQDGPAAALHATIRHASRIQKSLSDDFLTQVVQGSAGIDRC